MYMVMDTVTTWTWPYFVVLIVFGSFFAVNLALAVLFVYFTGAGTDGEIRMRRRSYPCRRRTAGGGDAQNALQKVCFNIASSTRFEQLTIVSSSLTPWYGVRSQPHQRSNSRLTSTSTFPLRHFVVEMIIKLIGFGPRGYAKDQMNLFDGFVVLMSCVEVVVGFISSDHDNNYLSVPERSVCFVFKLARSWKQLNDIITTMFKSLAGISYLSLILLLFMYVFALLGMQLFGYEFMFLCLYRRRLELPAGMTKECPDHFDCYAPCESSQVGQWVTFTGAGASGASASSTAGRSGTPAANGGARGGGVSGEARQERPREHSFDNIFWAFITIFQILTGENWNEVMYDGMRP